MKDIYVDGGKLARNGCKTAIFVSRKFWSSVALKNIKNQVQVDRGNHAQVPWCFGEFELLILNLLVQTLRPIRHYFLYSRAYSPKYSLRVLGDIFKATNEFETRTGLDVFFIRTLNHGFRFWKKEKRGKDSVGNSTKHIIASMEQYWCPYKISSGSQHILPVNTARYCWDTQPWNTRLCIWYNIHNCISF